MAVDPLAEVKPAEARRSASGVTCDCSPLFVREAKSIGAEKKEELPALPTPPPTPKGSPETPERDAVAAAAKRGGATRVYLPRFWLIDALCSRRGSYCVFVSSFFFLPLCGVALPFRLPSFGLLGAPPRLPTATPGWPEPRLATALSFRCSVGFLL